MTVRPGAGAVVVLVACSLMTILVMKHSALVCVVRMMVSIVVYTMVGAPLMVTTTLVAIDVCLSPLYNLIGSVTVTD